MIITFTGANGFMIAAELNKIATEFVSQYTDMGLEKIDGQESDYDKIRESLESMPFLAAKKLVLLRAPSANKQFTEKAELLLANVPDTTEVVIYEPKLDKRLAYYKFLKKHTQFNEYNELDTPALAKWLVATAKERGGSLGLGDASFLITRVGNNQQMLSNELDKLLQYDPNINKETILLLTDLTPQSTVFELLEASLGGKTEQAIRLYWEQRAAKVDPVQIMALLGWQLHVLALIKTAGTSDATEIATRAGISPYVVRKSMQLANRMTLDYLKDLVGRVRDLDIKIKSKSIDVDEAMLNLILHLNAT